MKSLLLNKTSWRTVWQQSWRGAIQIDRSKLTTVPSLRSTVGVALPLALGVATNHIIAGVSIAAGAAMLGSVGLSYAYGVHKRTMLLACLCVALSDFVGAITGHISWLSILLVGIWGFGAGMLVCISQPATVIGLQAVLALIIMSHFALPPVQAALQAALMFSGALLQTLLVSIPLPGERTALERSALTSVYQALADYAATPTVAHNGAVGDALLQAQQALTSIANHHRYGHLFFALLDQAEYLQLSLIVLSMLRQDMAGNPTVSGCVAQLDHILQLAADELRLIAMEIRASQPLDEHDELQQQLKETLAQLRQQTTACHDTVLMQQIQTYAEQLQHRLHTVKKLVQTGKAATYLRNHQLTQNTILAQVYRNMYDSWATIKANLTFNSSAFRHALRLSFTLMLAMALFHLSQPWLYRGYWIPLTVLLVLKPDFSTTFTRGVARFLGTLLGAILATLLVIFIIPMPDIVVLCTSIAAYLAFSFLLANYTLFSLFVTVEIVLLLSFVLPNPRTLAVYRAIDTVIGGTLALLIYILWPTWEHTQELSTIAQRLEASRRYLVAVLNAYTNPASYNKAILQTYRMQARLARSNAQASVARSLQEPEPERIEPSFAQGLLSAANTLVQNGLALEAHLTSTNTHQALPELAPFTASIDEALHLLVTAVRESQPVTTFPDLRNALASLKHCERCADLRVLLPAARRIVNSIEAMYHLVCLRGCEKVR